MTTPNFDARKTQILHDLEYPELTDLSPKGSVDIPILPLMEVVNKHENYVTTSSCSGRIAVYCDPIPIVELEEDMEASSNLNTPKGGGKWLFVTHDLVKKEEYCELDDAIKLCLPGVELVAGPEAGVSKELHNRLIWFKFEPMVLHVLCRDRTAGQELLATSLAGGYRNSGLMLNARGGCHLGIRCAAKLDVPIAQVINETDDGHIQAQLLVGKDYITMLVELANHRFVKNFDQMERFRKSLIENFKPKENLQVWEDKEARRERKKREGLERQKKLESEKMKNSHISKDNDSQ